MYKITICLVIFKLHTSSSQFPNHVDLQKVGEIIFNNEKYNILKPTAHIVTDYFKEYMQRRQNKQIPTKRVFIDNNGFRHFWNGFENKNKSLRKTIVAIEDNNDKINKSDGISEKDADKENNDSRTDEDDKNEHDVTTANINDTPAVNNDFVTIDDIPTTNNDSDDVSNDNVDSIETNETPTENNEDTDTVATEIITPKATPRRKTTTPHWSYFDPVKAVDIQLRGGKKDGKVPTETSKKENTKTRERTVAKTTFFCPFFGVMTMSAFVD